MLVIEREIGESITLRDSETGSTIGRIVLCHVKGGLKASIGFELPQSINIVRDEIDGGPNHARRQR